MFVPLNVDVFDPQGQLVQSTTTAEVRAPAGVLRVLQAHGVRSVEVHFEDRSSHEYTLMEEV